MIVKTCKLDSVLKSVLDHNQCGVFIHYTSSNLYIIHPLVPRYLPTCGENISNTTPWYPSTLME